MTLVFLFISFCTFTALTLSSPLQRQMVFRRSRKEWLIDWLGLLSQGVLVPALQIILGLYIWIHLLPHESGSWNLTWWQGFILAFVGVDALYYWNHRCLHGKFLWRLHLLHHSAKNLDVLITSRNSLFTPLAIVYVWINSLCLYLISDPNGFLWGVALTFVLDLWRHTEFAPSLGSVAHRLLSAFLITPHEHRMHHYVSEGGVNFGANLSVWDQLHGTFMPATQPDESLVNEPINLRQFFAP